MEAMRSYVLKHRYFFLFLACIDCMLFGFLTDWKSGLSHPYALMFVFAVQLIVLWFVFSAAKGQKPSAKQIVFLLFAIGFLLRLTYILSTNGSYYSGGYFITRQHDVHYFAGPDSYAVGENNGHAAYIEYFFQGNGLPDFDVRTVWQFYHPPLWHIICALWLKIQTVLGVSYQLAVENLQLLSLFCSSAIMLLSYRLFTLFSLKGKPLVIACAIVAFHPTFILLSGSINNDVLSLMLMMVSVILALKWYRNSTYKNILLLALAIGCAMMAKLSGGLVAVAVALLFFLKLCDKKHPLKKLLPQFLSFGAVCVPLALWHEIRNFILYKVPLTYVPGLSEKSDQYVGFRSVFERLFDISSLWENGVYPARSTEYLANKYGFTYFEYNIPVSALKSSVFGEYFLGADSPFLSVVASLLFWSAALLALISVIALILFLIRLIKAGKDRAGFASDNGFSIGEGAFTLVFHFTMIFSYVNFCFSYPHYCTMDFRYIALTVVLGALYIGLMLKNGMKNNSMAGRVLFWSTAGVTALYAVSACVIYTFAL